MVSLQICMNEYLYFQTVLHVLIHQVHGDGILTNFKKYGWIWNMF